MPKRASEAEDADRRGTEAAALVDAAKRGSARAFEELVRRYRPRIYALALHLTGRPSDADDITQDAFLKAYSRIHTFEGRSEFFTWLYRIALHRALNVKRNEGRRVRVDIDDARIAAALVVDAHGDPRRALELRETYTHLLAAFDALSSILRTTVVLTTLQGLSYKEAAIVLETNEGTIAWRVHEARKQMRATMDALESSKAPVKIAVKREKLLSEEQELSALTLAAVLAGALPSR